MVPAWLALSADRLITRTCTPEIALTTVDFPCATCPMVPIFSVACRCITVTSKGSSFSGFRSSNAYSGRLNFFDLLSSAIPWFRFTIEEWRRKRKATKERTKGLEGTNERKQQGRMKCKDTTRAHTHAAKNLLSEGIRKRYTTGGFKLKLFFNAKIIWPAQIVSHWKRRAFHGQRRLVPRLLLLLNPGK